MKPEIPLEEKVYFVKNYKDGKSALVICRGPEQIMVMEKILSEKRMCEKGESP